jgi:ribosomal protein S18
MISKKICSKFRLLNSQKANVQKYTRPKIREAEREEVRNNPIRDIPGNLLKGERYNLYPHLSKDKIPNKERPLRHPGDPTRARQDREKAKITRGIFKSMKGAISEEETQRRIERAVTEQRGGTVGYDGGLNEGYDDLMKKIENVAPQSYHAFPRASNKDQNEWLYNIPIGILQKKPTDDFEKEFMRSKMNWNEGRFMSHEKHRAMWKNTLATLPIFEKKPMDPFRAKPRAIQRISYKDPKTLVKFLSRGGRILNPRYTGVRWKTQRKIKREIHKARFLGLFPYLGNPIYNQAQYQANNLRTEDEKEDWLDSLLHEKTKFKDYIANLESGIQVSGNPKWMAPLSRKNPRFTNLFIQDELHGHTAEQLQDKAVEISHMESLDDTLVPFRKIIDNSRALLQ